MGGGVGGGKGDGDDEVGGGEPEKDQDEGLALPSWQEAPEHLDGSLAVGAFKGHLPVDGQGPEQRHEDEDGRRDRCEGSGGKEGDAGLVAEG